MKAVILYGSANDKPFMEPARDYFNHHQIAFEEHVLSAHRDTDALLAWLKDFEAQGAKGVILAVAGLSAALPGLVAVKTSAPVIGVPVPGGPLSGVDALLSIVQCPGGVPCTSVGLHKKAPHNAAMAVHKILRLAGAAD